MAILREDIKLEKAQDDQEEKMDCSNEVRCLDLRTRRRVAPVSTTEVVAVQTAQLKSEAFNARNLHGDYGNVNFWDNLILTTGKHPGVKLLATVDYFNGQIVVWWRDDHYTAENFMAFLRSYIKCWRLIL